MKGKVILGLKKALSKTPPVVGCSLSKVPFKYRLGNAYTEHRKAAAESATRDQIFSMVRNVALDAYETIPFYREFYTSKRFLPIDLCCFEDLSEIPIVRKSDLKEYDLSIRSKSGSKGILTNTGGTSGHPLALILDTGAYAREWGHMHTIWDRLEYKPSDMKLTLRGMNLGSKPIVYNFIHNEFQVNAYCDFDQVVCALRSLLKKYPIKYIHGYPSSIYEFVRQLCLGYPDVLGKLKSLIHGAFLGSEYPAPVYRDYIERELGIKTLSWYGHSEMAVLASERDERYLYYPFHSYGFTEAVSMDDGVHLIGTTIHNTVSPLIRYDTEDLIDPVSIKDGLLESFRVSKGRQGEFVLDKNGRRISLTALIFGRHHPLFGVADFVQVSQLTSGDMTIWVTSNRTDVCWRKYFDSSDVSMDIRFEVVGSPFKTASGKVPLLVNNYVN